MDANVQSRAENCLALQNSTLPRRWDTFDAYLFDIDGTLLNCTDAVHYFAFCEALKVLSGRELNLDGVTAHGNTDIGILRDALALAGVSEPSWRSRLSAACESMCLYVQTNRHRISAVILPGVLEILEHLRKRHAILGIATGNLQRIGSIKLASCDLLHRFDLCAFSDGLENRADVYGRAIHLARSRAGQHATICAIGDTPADIRAARHHGISIIAVSTGMHSLEQLSSEQPDLLLSSLRALLP